MAYTALPVVNTGDSWTAENHNTYFRDNFAASAPDIFTTKGDIAVAEGADTLNRLAVGANGSMLIAASGETLGVKWSDSMLGLPINLGRYTSTDWDGQTAYDTVIYVDAITDFSIPAAAKMLFGILTCQFNSGASSDYVNLSSSDYEDYPMIRCEWRNDTEYAQTSGWLLLSGDQFKFDPAGSNVNVKIEFFGYMI